MYSTFFSRYPNILIFNCSNILPMLKEISLCLVFFFTANYLETICALRKYNIRVMKAIHFFSLKQQGSALKLLKVLKISTLKVA